MGDKLGELREGLGRYAEGFDPALLSGEDASAVVEDAAAIEKTAAHLKALAAARVAETGRWKGGGERSAAHHLARRSGSSVSAAAEALEAARKLAALPEVSAAARRGELSPAQVSAIAGAAGADPSAEHSLLETARNGSLGELRDECARVRARAEDAEARRRRIHDGRYLRSHTDSEGYWHLQMRDNPEVGAEILSALAPIRDRLFREARAEGRREPAEAYGADALAEMARREAERQAEGEAGASAGEREAGDAGHPAPNGDADPATAGPAGPSNGASRPRRRWPGTKVLVRIDLPALLRGYACGEELCELVGYGPVAVSAVRDMIECGDPFLVAVATRGVDVVGVAHLGRRPTAHQQSALEWLYPTCAVAGCNALARLEVDHRVEWAASHFTLLELLDRLCPAHHHLKTTEGWSLVEGKGKRDFVPPGDARHPGRGGGGARAPAAAATGPPGTS